MSLLNVEDLAVEYDTEDGTVRAVDGVSFSVEPGENVGIVGESGCGKSTLAQAVLGTLPDNGSVAGGSVAFRDTDLTGMDRPERRRHMWEEIAMIPQSAMTGLDPVYTVRDQILETFDVHRPDAPRTETNERVDELFELVGLDPARADDYPHQFSGGMRQRAMIAMALALDPALILADEPTTALDVIMQDQILKRIGAIQDEIDSSMVIITHDVSVVAETCDRVLVMYAGELVEEGPVEQIFEQPYHPYTVGLKRAFPNIREGDQELISIPGHPPGLENPPGGCRFAARCPMAEDACRAEEPPTVERGGLRTRCHRVDEVDEVLRPRAGDLETWEDVRRREQP